MVFLDRIDTIVSWLPKLMVHYEKGAHVRWALIAVFEMQSANPLFSEQLSCEHGVGDDNRCAIRGIRYSTGSSREMMSSFHYFPMSDTFFLRSRQIFLRTSGNDRRVLVDLSTKIRTTLKKSFPKSIKKSAHNRFQKLDISCSKKWCFSKPWYFV